MIRVHTRHARCTRPAYGTREHFDWSANGDSLRELEPAEHIQADPLTIIRSIERVEMLWAIGIVTACVVIAGALNIMGGNA